MSRDQHDVTVHKKDPTIDGFEIGLNFQVPKKVIFRMYMSVGLHLGLQIRTVSECGH